jgi:hypothetical protein
LLGFALRIARNERAVGARLRFGTAKHPNPLVDL